MIFKRLLQTDKDGEPEPELPSSLHSISSSALPSSTLSLSSTIKEPHKALFHAFGIWTIYSNVFSHVAPADQAALALTCRRLRKTLAGVADVETLRKRLPRPAFLDVLWAIAFDLPDHYVCEQCMYLHRSAQCIRSVQTTNKKTKSTITNTNTAARHAYDMSLIQKASEDFLRGIFAPAPIPELEPPCRHSLSLAASSPSPAPLYDAGMSSITFTSRLSSTRRTPLSGLTHRDVQLLLKRVRLLREGKEGSETEPIEAKCAKQNVAEQETSPNSSSRWKFWRSKLNRPPLMLRRTEGTTTKGDLIRAVRCALQPFLAQREVALADSYSGPATIKYKLVPRIVLGDSSYQLDGGGCGRRPRFLLQTEISMKYIDNYVMPMAICPHQMINKKDCPVWMRAKMDAWVGLPTSYSNLYTPTPESMQHMRPPFRLFLAVYCVSNDAASRKDCVQDRHTHPNCHNRRCYEDYSFKHLSESTRVMSASKRACAMARAQISGPVISASCDRCPTDFVVHMANDRVGRLAKDEMVITVWQDFGAEAPVTDEVWQSHIPGLFLQSELDNAQAPYTEPNTWQTGPRVSHSPGSVRALFETGDLAYKF